MIAVVADRESEPAGAIARPNSTESPDTRPGHQESHSGEWTIPSHDRDLYLDVLKSLAAVTVVVAHWLTTAIVIGAGGWHIASPLDTMSGLSWFTLLIQPLAVFFCVGGLTSAQSLDRADLRGETARHWVHRRFGRLLRPTLWAAGVWAVIVIAMVLLQVPWMTIRTVVVLLVQPLWFVGIYAVLALVTPLAARADNRWGWRVPMALAAAVAVIDFLRYGPFSAAMPGWVSLGTIVPGWLFGYQLGIAAARRTPTRRIAMVLTAAGIGGYLIALACGYPPTPMGPAIDGRVNSHPPSLLMVAATAIFVGGLWWAEPVLRRWFARRWATRLAGSVAPRTLEILCWHQVALALCAALVTAGGLLPDAAAVDGSWLLGRVVMLPVLALILAGILRLVGPRGLGAASRLSDHRADRPEPPTHGPGATRPPGPTAKSRTIVRPRA